MAYNQNGDFVNITNDELKARIGDWVYYYRRARGITRKKLATKIGIPTSILERIENNQTTRMVPLEILSALGNALEQDVSSFLAPGRPVIKMVKEVDPPDEAAEAENHPLS